MASQKLRTGYLGPEASFSHQAAVESLPDTIPVPLPSFAAILTGIQKRQYDFAVLPIENSTNGSVVQALDLLALCTANQVYSDVEVIDEHYLEVHHALYVPRALVEKRLSMEECNGLPVREKEPEARNAGLQQVLEKLDIKMLHTHPQVWGQCNKILSALLPPGRVERVDTSSTSAAAGFVAAQSTDAEMSGAISSKLAGKKHEDRLVCLAEDIEDNPGANTTRFLILKNKHSNLKKAASVSAMQTKSLWTFTISHYEPGALARALAIYAKHNFNLCAIQSRPRPQPESGLEILNWRYIFFVESLHQESAQASIQALIQDLEDATEQVTLLGAFDADLAST